MSSFQLAEFILWKSTKQKQEEEYEDMESQFSLTKPYQSDDIVFSSEMLCRVCTGLADIPVTDEIDGINILSAIRRVSYVWVSNRDPYPKYICKNCLEELKVALTFRKKCETSDSFFRKTYSQTHDEYPSSMIKHDFASIINQIKERRLRRMAININKNNLHEKSASKVLKQENGKGVKDMSVKIIKCVKCDIKFETQDLLARHHREKNCVCPPCPICGKMVSNLQRHKKLVHMRTEKYTCHVCGKISYTAVASRNHLLVHSDKCNFSCPLCPYKGKLQSYLTMHMRTHTGEKPYLCSECPAKFITPSNLRKHQLTHSNKNFECTKCKKLFRLKKSLQEHYDAAHLNVRYRCSICGRDLWTRRKLLSHELKVHNREKHQLYNKTHKVVLNRENN